MSDPYIVLRGLFFTLVEHMRELRVLVVSGARTQSIFPLLDWGSEMWSDFFLLPEVELCAAPWKSSPLRRYYTTGIIGC